MVSILFSMLLSAHVVISGQPASGCPLVFDAPSIDFGTVPDEGGALFHIFTFINSSSSPVRISQALVSCNCVTAAYPDNFIKGGETGTVSVAFNPAGLSGKVSRQVEVFTGDGIPGVVLEMTAVVEPVSHDITDLYRTVLPGGLRMASTSCRFGYVSVGKTEERSVGLLNACDQPMEIDFEQSAQSVFSVVGPRSLSPGEAGTLIVSCRVPSRAYGSYSDELFLTVNGDRCTRPLEISAVAVDDRDAVSDGKVPSMQIFPSFLEARKSLLTGKYSASFEISNVGVTDLVMRKVMASEGTETDLDGNCVIKPGKKRRVSVRSHSESFRVEMISNDPVRPYKELRTTNHKH